MTLIIILLSLPLIAYGEHRRYRRGRMERMTVQYEQAMARQNWRQN